MNKQINRPLVPEDTTRPRASSYFFRAAAATLRAHVRKCEPEQACRELFERDAVTPILLRAASTAATISNSTWAGALAATAIEDLVMEISSMSAAAALMQKGLKLDFGAYAQIKAPGRICDANDGGTWVAEGSPVVVRAQRITAGALLQPRKLILIRLRSLRLLTSCRRTRSPRSSPRCAPSGKQTSTTRNADSRT